MLSEAQIFKFYALHSSLMLFVAQRIGLSPAGEHPQQYAARPVGERLMVRNLFLDDPAVVDDFLRAYPLMEAEEGATIRAWRDYHVEGRFLVAKYVNGDAILLTTTEDVVTGYLIAPLFSPFEEVFGIALPVMTDTVLLPFEGQIVADGLYSTIPMNFPAELKQLVKETVLQSEGTESIARSLPPASRKVKTKRRKRK